ncbi:gamma-glutamylcyclotransferase family protein [Leptothoe kymatousa]|uniref:Putative gamma-glutamylcyclotransferase n=1 Tax=Leptothoe kymatousa TAU-MAC 1615 TaxID=2364775 RepID=A0ABS5Y5V6_9CYAN|nr:gamma-glutamylcyclotransferase family protein [Leptothoe kymatousa]MBT9313227.1 gamma-glutamylcyclotransferase [Leptothoe kymatousa TAU-MAC 1615]
MQRLFVYGTLGPGRPNEHVLSAIGGTWEKAMVQGYLRPQGWGAAMGYPGIVLDETGDEILGHVFCSEHLAAHWAELDEFEGEDYRRVVVNVKMQNDEMVEAYVYVLRDKG